MICNKNYLAARLRVCEIKDLIWVMLFKVLMYTSEFKGSNRLALRCQIAVLNQSIEVFSKKDRPILANSFWILASQDLYFLNYLVNTHNPREYVD